MFSQVVESNRLGGPANRIAALGGSDPHTAGVSIEGIILKIARHVELQRLRGRRLSGLQCNVLNVGAVTDMDHKIDRARAGKMPAIRSGGCREIKAELDRLPDRVDAEHLQMDVERRVQVAPLFPIRFFYGRSLAVENELKKGVAGAEQDESQAQRGDPASTRVAGVYLPAQRIQFIHRPCGSPTPACVGMTTKPIRRIGPPPSSR